MNLEKFSLEEPKKVWLQPELQVISKDLILGGPNAAFSEGDPVFPGTTS